MLRLAFTVDVEYGRQVESSDWDPKRIEADLYDAVEKARESSYVTLLPTGEEAVRGYVAIAVDRITGEDVSERPAALDLARVNLTKLVGVAANESESEASLGVEVDHLGFNAALGRLCPGFWPFC